MKTLYVRLSDEAHDTISEIAVLAGLSMAATVEAMVNVEACRHHIYATQYKAAVTEYVNGENRDQHR